MTLSRDDTEGSQGAARREPLSLAVTDEVALITLDRPEKRNALSLELRDELARLFDTLGRDEDVACIVLTGAGNAFCAGMDRTQFGGDRQNREHIVRASIGAFRALSRCPKPTIAAVNGPALGGGFALALLCDLLVASHAARFGFAEVTLGIPAAYAAARVSLRLHWHENSRSRGVRCPRTRHSTSDW